MLLARVYGLPVFSTAVDALPLIGHLGEQYIWVAIALLFTLLLPFGLEAVLRDGTRVAPLIVTALIIMERSRIRPRSTASTIYMPWAASRSSLA